MFRNNDWKTKLKAFGHLQYPWGQHWEAYDASKQYILELFNSLFGKYKSEIFLN